MSNSINLPDLNIYIISNNTRQDLQFQPANQDSSCSKNCLPPSCAALDCDEKSPKNRKYWKPNSSHIRHPKHGASQSTVQRKHAKHSAKRSDVMSAGLTSLGRGADAPGGAEAKSRHVDEVRWGDNQFPDLDLAALSLIKKQYQYIYIYIQIILYKSTSQA